jgi:hypothetical protein
MESVGLAGRTANVVLDCEVSRGVVRADGGSEVRERANWQGGIMVKIDLNLEERVTRDNKQTSTYWKVKGCYVHMADDTNRPLGSNDQYASKDDAKKEMEKRVLKLLKENGRTETAGDLKWKIRTSNKT